MPDRSDPEALSTLAVGLIGILVVVLIVLLLQVAYYRVEAREVWLKKYSKPTQELTQLRAQQQARLSGYYWIDRQQGVVAIPIEQAMKLIVKEQAAMPGAGRRYGGLKTQPQGSRGLVPSPIDRSIR